jgi:hypothetical protein
MCQEVIRNCSCGKEKGSLHLRDNVTSKQAVAGEVGVYAGGEAKRKLDENIGGKIKKLKGPEGTEKPKRTE